MERWLQAEPCPGVQERSRSGHGQASLRWTAPRAAWNHNKLKNMTARGWMLSLLKIVAPLCRCMQDTEQAAGPHERRDGQAGARSRRWQSDISPVRPAGARSLSLSLPLSLCLSLLERTRQEYNTALRPALHVPPEAEPKCRPNVSKIPTLVITRGLSRRRSGDQRYTSWCTRCSCCLTWRSMASLGS